MENINLKKIKKAIVADTEDINTKYINIEDLKSIKAIDSHQKDCSGESGEKPTWWTFINYTEKKVLGRWSDTYDKEFFIKKLRPTLNVERLDSCKDYWMDPESPFSPALDDKHGCFNERGEDITIYRNCNTNFSNKYFKNHGKDKFILYVEYAYSFNARDNENLRGDLYLINFNN